MSQTLRNIQSARQGNTTNVVSFPAMLEQLKGEIARALPKHLSRGAHGADRTDCVSHESEAV
jgi:hypothetical protein